MTRRGFMKNYIAQLNIYTIKYNTIVKTLSGYVRHRGNSTEVPISLVKNIKFHRRKVNQPTKLF